MDAFTDPTVSNVVVMSSAQVGKTEVLLNVLGHFIDQDPGPILVVMPTLEMAQAFSKDRLAPMIRDTPRLHGKIGDPRSRDGDNTVLHKLFPGGHLTIAGANSPASLASRPVRVVLCDEVDRFPVSAGMEGDPVDLAVKRSTNFWNRRVGLFSTPTVKNQSRIELAFEASDQRRFYVPCPRCGHFQALVWGNVIWPKAAPEAAHYECEACRYQIGEGEKLRMIRLGEWRPMRDFSGSAGFALSEIYSPWSAMADMAKTFLQAKQSSETLQVWVNTSLGEAWEDEAETIEDSVLLGRREQYGPVVPAGGGVLTTGVDVQDDRLECEVVAWGLGEESWSVAYQIFYGDPAQPAVWEDLDSYLGLLWEHESGARLRIAAACIDSGGHHTKAVYAFVRPREGRRIFAVKGASTPGKPLVSRPNTNNLGGVKLFTVGVDTAKATVFSRLRIGDPGPGFMHFPASHDEEYFRQLTAEKVVTKYRRGFPYRQWEKTRTRNDALDCRVYAMAALAIINPPLQTIMAALSAAQDKTPPPAGPVYKPAHLDPFDAVIERRKKTGYTRPSWLDRR